MRKSIPVLFLLVALSSPYQVVADTVLLDDREPTVDASVDAGVDAPVVDASTVVLPDAPPPPPPPPPPDSVDRDLENLVNAWNTGGLVATVAALVLLLVGLLKRPAMAKLLWEHLPPSLRPAVPLLLAALASVLAAVSGVAQPVEATVSALSSGFVAMGLYQVTKRRS